MRALPRLRTTLVFVVPVVFMAASSCSTTPGEGSGASGGSSTGGSLVGTSGGSAGGPMSSGGALPASGGTAPATGGASSGSGGAIPATGGASSGGSATGGAQGGASGSGSGGSAAGGAAGTAGAMLKGPIARDGKCVFEFGDIYFEVDPAAAGRVTSARVVGSELLTGKAVNPINYGSTFWTSPQADWNQWPPVPEIDSMAFTQTADATSCTLVGPKTVSAFPAVDGVSITKKFSVDLAKQSMVIDYTIKNESTTTKRAAPWEITRVAPGGLTFYASDTAPTGPKMPPTTSTNGYTWFQHSSAVPVETKLFADGKGWIAHVTTDKRLLVKAFPDVPPGAAATAEAEIEIYSVAGYVEVENQGVPADIAAGSSTTWTVRWYLKQLPASVTVMPNNPELIQIVQQTLQ